MSLDENNLMEPSVVIDDSSEIEDEYNTAYELLEESNSNSISDYQALLSNSRIDDKAIKIKEQCIYR